MRVLTRVGAGAAATAAALFSRSALRLLLLCSLTALALLTGVGETHEAAAAPLCKGLSATIVGTAGNDTLYGTSGNEVIQARGGNDIVYGKGGRDIICGGRGADKLYGGRGADGIYGGKGKDIIVGGRGRDGLKGDAGDDKIYGKAGTDACRGGSGTDTLRSCERRCASAYPTVCIPPPPPDLNCGDILYRNFKVRSSDPHKFDTDKDGIGCETG